MGDLGADTAVSALGDGRYKATLSPDWRIWGPMGGYIASTALRAAGAESPFARPASFSCQYLGVAAFAEIDIEVTTLRSARTALCQRVTVTQEGKAMLEAQVWSVGAVDGLEHDVTTAPMVAHHRDLPTIEELLTDEERAAGPPFTFWSNFDSKPLAFSRGPRQEGAEPVWQQWNRFKVPVAQDDPWLDGCRSLILIDIQSWPAAGRAHPWDSGFIAPTLDLYVAFHEPHPESEWLLCDGAGPIARDGLMGWNGRLWSDQGKLVASGTGQMLCRRVPG